MSLNRRDSAMLTALVVFWALNYPLVKLALLYTTPFDLMLFRLLFSIPFLAVLTPRSFIPLRSLRANAELALFSLLDVAITWGLWYMGEAYVSPSLAVLIMYTYPIITVALGAAILRERLTRKGVLGVALGFAGLAVIFSSELRISNIEGPLLILLSALSWSFGVIFYKTRLSSYDPSTVNTYQLLYAVPVAILMAFAAGPVSFRPSISLILIMLTMSFPGTALAFYIYVSLYSKNEVVTVTPYLFLVPALSVVFSYLLLRTGLTRLAWIGFLLLSLGIILSSKR